MHVYVYIFISFFTSGLYLPLAFLQPTMSTSLIMKGIGLSYYALTFRLSMFLLLLQKSFSRLGYLSFYSFIPKTGKMMGSFQKGLFFKIWDYSTVFLSVIKSCRKFANGFVSDECMPDWDAFRLNKAANQQSLPFFPIYYNRSIPSSC